MSETETQRTHVITRGSDKRFCKHSNYALHELQVAWKPPNDMRDAHFCLEREYPLVTMGNRNNRLGQEEAHHQDDPYGDVWQRPEAFWAARSQPLQAARHQIAEVQIP